MIKFIKRLIRTYIGNLQYVVEITSVDGTVKMFTHESIKEVDKFVCGINSETYWSVSSIEKRIILPYKYDKEVIHTPLWFSIDSVTERAIIDGDSNEYSFLKKHESLRNIKRTSY